MVSRIDKWYVFNCLVYCGILCYNEDTKEFSFILENDCPRARAVMEKLHTNDDQEWFKESIFDRVVPPNRVNIKEILRKLGMVEYDAWEIVKRAHLCTCDDAIWMSKEKDPNGWYKYNVFSEILPLKIAQDPNINA